MAYRIIVSQRAQNEITEAIDYYALSSVDAPLHFIVALEKAYEKLKGNPYYETGIKRKGFKNSQVSLSALFCCE